MARSFHGQGTITPVVRTEEGKKVRVYFLQMAAQKKSGRERIRRYFAKRQDAEEARLAELGLRNPHTAHIFNLPASFISMLAEKYKAVQQQPPEIRDSYNWNSEFDASLKGHIWKTQAVSFQTLVDQYIDEQYKLAKDGDLKKKKAYVCTLKWSMRALYDEQGRFSPNSNIKLIDPVVLNDVLLDLQMDYEPETVKTIIRNVQVMFRRGVQWKYLTENPVAGAKFPPLGKRIIEIQTSDQAHALMTTAWDYCPELLPRFALGYLLAFSPCEIDSMNWSQMLSGFKGAHLGNDTTKQTRSVREREVELINPEQAAWFAPFAGKTGPVNALEALAENLQRVRIMAARDFGIEIPPWRGAMCRRTSISHLYHSELMTLEQLKKRVGHARTSDIIFKNYIAFVKKSEAPRLFNRMPPDRPWGTKQFPPNLLEDARKAEERSQ